MTDGIGVATRLAMLSTSFERLTRAGVPPGLDEVSYLAELSTLASFADLASEEMSYAPMEGSARYAVIRQKAGALLADISKATGHHLALPWRSTTAHPTSSCTQNLRVASKPTTA